MKLHMNLGEHSYDIHLSHGCIHHIGEAISLQRKVLIITDDGVPDEYNRIVAKQCQTPFVHTVKQGEGSKSFAVYQEICQVLLSHHFSRKDLIVALGGGVVGDLSGFVAATYMRGIDFIQIPTTTLSQIDSSIGGKVAINLDGVKNIIGAFYQPKAVFIDPDTLHTLPKRHYYNGLVEALKAGLIADFELFALFEQDQVEAHLDEIIAKALTVKKKVVEQDEKEQGLRKILNFGHTIGHAIESCHHLHDYYHGECVAFGMMYFMDDPALKQRVAKVYERLHLPLTVDKDYDQWLAVMRNDKKAHDDTIDTVWVHTPGKAEIVLMTLDEIGTLMEKTI